MTPLIQIVSVDRGGRVTRHWQVPASDSDAALRMARFLARRLPGETVKLLGAREIVRRVRTEIEVSSAGKERA